MERKHNSMQDDLDQRPVTSFDEDDKDEKESELSSLIELSISDLVGSMRN